MFKSLAALGKTARASLSGADGSPGAPGSDLKGTWLPTKHSLWYNRNIGKHSKRAEDPKTRRVFNEAGSKAEGWVGEVYVYLSSVCQLAPGQYTCTASVPTRLWAATDGNMTLLENGKILELRFPSNAIVEYWRREDGGSVVGRRKTEGDVPSSHSDGYMEYALTLCLRRVTGIREIPYHWGLAIGCEMRDIYEMNGAMAIYGPGGVIATNNVIGGLTGPRKGTKLSQFDARLVLTRPDGKKYGTRRQAGEIEAFCRQWVVRHPIYSPAGPNCQTFVEDLFTFCTGENLPFHKVGDLKRGPEFDERVHWMDKSKKPG